MNELEKMKMAYLVLGRYLGPWLMSEGVVSIYRNLKSFFYGSAIEPPFHWRKLLPNRYTAAKAYLWVMLQLGISEFEKIFSGIKELGRELILETQTLHRAETGFFSTLWNGFKALPTLPYQYYFNPTSSSTTRSEVELAPQAQEVFKTWLCNTTSAKPLMENLCGLACKTNRTEELLDTFQSLLCKIAYYPDELADSLCEDMGISKNMLFVGLATMTAVSVVSYHANHCLRRFC